MPTVSNDADEVLTVKEAIALFKIGRNTLYDAIGRNEVPHRKFGRAIRFSRRALLRWLDSQSSEAQDRSR